MDVSLRYLYISFPGVGACVVSDTFDVQEVVHSMGLDLNQHHVIWKLSYFEYLQQGMSLNRFYRTEELSDASLCSG